MTEEKIIYSIEYDEYENDFITRPIPDDGEECSIAYISSPSRTSMRKLFIKKCIEFSERHRISLTVSEDFHSVYAAFTFKGIVFFDEIKPILLVADGITVAQEGDHVLFELNFFSKEPILIPPEPDTEE